MKKFEIERKWEVIFISLSYLTVLSSVLYFLCFCILSGTVVNPKLNVSSFLIFMFIGILMMPSVVSLFKQRLSLDAKIKEVIFPDINEKLYPLLYVAWSKTPLAPKFFNDLMDEHKIMKINKGVFSSDDKFSCRFNDMNFDIYEVENRYSSSVIVNLIINMLYGLLWLVLACGFGFLMFCVFQLILKATPIPEDIITPLSAKIAIIISFVVVLAANLNVINFNGAKTNLKPVSLGIIDRFKGLIVRFEMPKYYKGHTIIFENDKENAFVKLLAGNKYEKVELEDVEFNKKFSVYSTDQVEARYALTSGMMDRLLNLKQTFKSKYIRASFSGKRFVMGIQSDKDLFCMASLWKKSDSKDYQTMFLELISILKITDALNLQNDTGL